MSYVYLCCIYTIHQSTGPMDWATDLTLDRLTVPHGAPWKLEGLPMEISALSMAGWWLNPNPFEKYEFVN